MKNGMDPSSTMGMVSTCQGHPGIDIVRSTRNLMKEATDLLSSLGGESGLGGMMKMMGGGGGGGHGWWLARASALKMTTMTSRPSAHHPESEQDQA
jgi:hypothetical protein